MPSVRRLLLAALALVVTAPLFVYADQPPRATPLTVEELRTRPTYDVAAVVDGDTVKVTIDGQVESIRLIGVDTPETVHPTQPVEVFGREASAFTKAMLDGRQVWLEYDGPQPARDRYGRLLAYIYRVPDGTLINLEIVRQGYGEAYVQYPFRFMELFRAVGREAREANRGLWAVGGAEVEAAAAAAEVEAGTVRLSAADVEHAVATMHRTALFLYHQADEPARARELWEAALRLDPDNEAIREKLGGAAGPTTPPPATPNAPQAQRPAAPAGPTVYITATGERYHRAGCRHLRGGGTAVSLAEAQRRGLTPCAVCKP